MPLPKFFTASQYWSPASAVVSSVAAPLLFADIATYLNSPAKYLLAGFAFGAFFSSTASNIRRSLPLVPSYIDKTNSLAARLHIKTSSIKRCLLGTFQFGVVALPIYTATLINYHGSHASFAGQALLAATVTALSALVSSVTADLRTGVKYPSGPLNGSPSSSNSHTPSSPSLSSKKSAL